MNHLNLYNFYRQMSDERFPTRECNQTTKQVYNEGLGSAYFSPDVDGRDGLLFVENEEDGGRAGFALVFEDACSFLSSSWSSVADPSPLRSESRVCDMSFT